jgi:hypothetical protein
VAGMHVSIVRARRQFGLSAILVLALVNAAAVGCNGSSPEDDDAGGEGGEMPEKTGGRTASGGTKGAGGRSASGGRRSSGGSPSSGGMEMGGNAGDSSDGGTTASGGSQGSPSVEDACQAWALHMADEAKGTSCTVDVEAIVTTCKDDTPSEACLETRLEELECRKGLDYVCEAIIPELPPELFTQDPACNDSIVANQECEWLEAAPEGCAEFAQRTKEATESLGCTDGDGEDESIFYALETCNSLKADDACSSVSDELISCLTQAPSTDFRCADTGAATASQTACATERESRNECLLGTVGPECNAYGSWLLGMAESIDCQVDLAGSLESCETAANTPGCSSQSSAYFTCLENSGDVWACSDELGPYQTEDTCNFQYDRLDLCMSCAGKPETASAQITITADDQYRLWVNGALVSETLPSWSSVETYTIAIDPRSNHPNVIAIEATNGAALPELDRSAIAVVTFGEEKLVTDQSWLVYDGNFGALDADWIYPEFDTTGFDYATSWGQHGIEPWNEVSPALDGAEWIWAAPTDPYGNYEGEAQTVYLRRLFFVDSSGALVSEPSRCY